MLRLQGENKQSCIQSSQGNCILTLRINLPYCFNHTMINTRIFHTLFHIELNLISTTD